MRDSGGHLFSKMPRATVKCDFQRIRKPSWHNEFPLFPMFTLEPFDKWVIDLVGPISPPKWWTGAWYIFIVTKYLTHWAKAMPVKDYSADTSTCFLFQNVITWFGFPKVLISDQGSHFLNQIVHTLMDKFLIHHQKITPYNLQSNGMIKAFNKALEHSLTKICNAMHNV